MEKVRMLFWINSEHRDKLKEAARLRSIEQGRQITMLELFIDFINSL